ncbi:MAG: hypothetical protein A3G09_01795 [Candidatus Moranbacteria bacterium RIFCSPLOWO2_12_FULL_48_12]|nr:MAG: hypothetical protein A3G09_01795 [Candidatus Moranbacteria bacterium RIFCSPLOWO2_12_FULL_48_12]
MALAKNILKAASQPPLVLLIGLGSAGNGATDFLSGVKARLPHYKLFGVVTSFVTIEEFRVRLEAMLGKYPSLRLVVLRLRGVDTPGELIKIIKEHKLAIFGIAPMREKSSADLLDFGALKIAGCYEGSSCTKNVAIGARKILNITTPYEDDASDNTVHFGGIARRGNDDFFPWNDGEDVERDVDLSVSRRGRPRTAELRAIEGGTDMPSTPSPARAQPPAALPENGNRVEIPAFLTNPGSGSPKLPKIGSRVRPLLLLRPESPPPPPEPTAPPAVNQLKPVRPPAAAQPKRKTMKNKRDATNNSDSATLIKQVEKGAELLLARRTLLMAEVSTIDKALLQLGHISEIGISRAAELTAEEKARRKPGKKSAASKTLQRASTKKANDHLRKGQEIISLEGKDTVMSKGTAWVFKQFLVKQKTILPDADLQNGKSLDMVVQRLIDVRKVLKARYGAKGSRALVTHVKEGHSLDLSLAH